MFVKGQSVLALHRDKWVKALYIHELKHCGREGQHLVTILPSEHDLIHSAIVKEVKEGQ